MRTWKIIEDARRQRQESRRRKEIRQFDLEHDLKTPLIHQIRGLCKPYSAIKILPAMIPDLTDD
jgi:hypothetical protein